VNGKLNNNAKTLAMGATAEDIALTVHARPTLSETVMECAEVFFGQATHTFTKKKTAE
jgi:dihydrolipoamide dehydrogenase